MGLRTENYAFTEMLSTEEWALEMIPQPAIGILFLYEETPVQKQHKEAESHHLNAANIPQDLFFMRQYARNACGTIALFHIILNAASKYPDMVVPGSYLDTFKTNSTTIDPKARGELFKNSKEILTHHQEAVVGGQSEVQNECDSHFIAIINHQNKLIELDGMKEAPVDHGECSSEDFLKKGSGLISQFMQRDPENIHFSMIVLAPVAQE